MEEVAQSVCEVCGGTGWEVVLEGNISRAKRCSCSREPANDRLVKLAKIPPRFLGCEFENYEPQSFHQERAKSLLMNYVADYPHLDDEIFREAGLLFTGRSGRGKTHLAVAVMKGLLKKGISCLFVDFHELLAEIRNSYDELSQTSELQILRPILNVDVLLLDDLASQRMTEWMQDTVFHIINLRYGQKKPLIVTTNLSMEPLKGSPQSSLQDRLGYRVISRLYEMCTGIDVDSETDYRKDVRKAGSDLLRNKKEVNH
jgi:DNA replication protein DnaC